MLISSSAALAQTAAQQPFRLGAVVPLAGPLADYGAAVRNGFEAAKKDYPEKFRNIDIVYQDSSYDGKTSLNAFNALFARGDVDLYYVWGVTPNETLLPVLNARKLPVISETTLKSSLVNMPLAIRASPSGDMTAKVLSEQLLRRGSRSIGVLLVDIPYYRDIAEALKGYLERGGAKLEIIDTYAPDANDFKTVIAKLKARHYDAVGVFLLNDQIITYYRQAFTLKYTAQSFGAGIHDSQDLMSRAGPGAEGAFLIGYDVTDAFRKRWIAEYGDDSRIGSGANAYDTAIMIADLFGDGRSHGLSPSEIVPRFAGILQRQGVSGTFGYADTPDAGKHFDLPLSARVVQNGRIVPIQ
jgi:branched-chain amino acid transport system substrate-binding protein